MSELFDQEVNAQKQSLKKNFRGSRKLPYAHEKVCDENERNKQRNKETRKKRRARKNIFGGRKPFIRRIKNWGKRSPQASSQ